jgi:hypothetical protein
MNESGIVERLVVSTRGLQVRRKDRDMMTDTGGSSKRPEREPEQKPPRYDCKNPYRTKNKPAPERDPDTDNDRDLKMSAIGSVVASRRAAISLLSKMPSTFVELMRRQR